MNQSPRNRFSKTRFSNKNFHTLESFNLILFFQISHFFWFAILAADRASISVFCQSFYLQKYLRMHLHFENWCNFELRLTLHPKYHSWKQFPCTCQRMVFEWAQRKVQCRQRWHVVFSAPESWSKYFFFAVFNLFCCLIN